MSDARRTLQELTGRLPDLAENLRALDDLLDRDVPSALNKARFITEKVLHRLCVGRGVSWGDAEPTLERMVGPLVASGALPKNVAVQVRTVQSNVNFGSHFQEAPPSAAHLRIATAALTEFLGWYATASCGEGAVTPAAAPPGLRILVVEESSFNQRIASALLQKEGHTPTVVATGEQALEVVHREPFDLILMQVQLPGMSGFEATARIRQRGQGRSTPILGMTSEFALRERCLGADMDGTISRPLRLVEFLDSAKYFRAIDWTNWLKDCRGDRSLMRELASVFLEAYPGWLGEIRDALATQDAGRVRHRAHGLKGVVTSLCAQAAREAAAELEEVARRGGLARAADLYPALERCLERVRSELTRFLAEPGDDAVRDRPPAK